MSRRFLAPIGIAMLIGPFLVSALSCPSASWRITRNLSFGAQGRDVVGLQDFLIAEGDLATGNATGYFGQFTEAAVKKFQCRKNIVCAGSPATTGYGMVGPQTRAAIAAACAQASTSPPAPERASCFFAGFFVRDGENVVAFKWPLVPQGSACISETRVCDDGALSGGYPYSACGAADPTPPPAPLTPGSCSWNGTSVPDGDHVTAYLSPSVPIGTLCISQVRTCAGGTLSGTYMYAVCVAEPAPEEDEIHR